MPSEGAVAAGFLNNLDDGWRGWWRLPCAAILNLVSRSRRKWIASPPRARSQPLRSKDRCGSTFKNPDGHKAWALVDEAGCRGLKLGGAQVSEKHTNFLLNTGDASSADIEALGEGSPPSGEGKERR